MPRYDDWADRVEDPGEHAIQFIERRLRHTKGEFAGRPFMLEPWQREGIIRPLFGTIDDEGYRQYRTAYIEMARKNGKSEIAAAVALKLLFADGEPGAEIYSAAADRDQASIVFNVAKDMVEANKGLRKRAKIYRTKVIEVPGTGCVYKAISADAFSKHGFNAHGIIFDELHAQPNRELWDVLTTSTGARRQALVFAITTAGWDRKSICWEQHEYAEKVLSGKVHDPSFFAYIMALAERCDVCPPDLAMSCEHVDWRNERNWYKANPALGVFRSIAEMRRLVVKAQESPALQNTVRRLYLSQWTKQDERWLDLSAWDRAAGSVDEAELVGKFCYAGLDLASTIDVAAFVMVFPVEVVTETPEGNEQVQIKFKVVSRFWIPQETVTQRTRKDNVPYESWVQRGLITATPGNVIDHDRIKQDIIELRNKHEIRDIGYDRWNATQLVVNLQDAGFVCTPIGQGFGSLSAPTKDLMTYVLDGSLEHGGNPVLRWMADNMAVTQDAADNVKPDKKKSTEKIDGMVALIMGLDRAVRQGHKPSVYLKRGFVILGG